MQASPPQTPGVFWIQLVVVIGIGGIVAPAGIVREGDDRLIEELNSVYHDRGILS
jgi:hypothetical protein